jgi:hypothetical protein
MVDGSLAGFHLGWFGGIGLWGVDICVVGGSFAVLKFQLPPIRMILSQRFQVSNACSSPDRVWPAFPKSEGRCINWFIFFAYPSVIIQKKSVD